MSILRIIKTRRSVRAFGPAPVPEELVAGILEAGRWAPSGLNNQPWKFAVVEDQALRAKISGLTHYSKIVRGAKALICVFLDNTETYNRTKDVQAVGACIQNMLLQIHSLGLGAVWLGEILKSDADLRGILGLGGELELMAVLAVGFPAEEPKRGKRKQLKDLVVFRK